MKQNEFKKIDELCDIRRGASPRPISDPKFFGGNVGWVRILDVTSSSKYLNETEQYVSKLGEKNSLRVEKGQLIMSICGTIGKPIIVNIPACIHDGFVKLYNLSDVVLEYLYYILQFSEEKLKAFGQPGTQVNLNTTLVGNLEVFVPQILEQQKIAEILTTIDNIIEKTEQIIEKYKKVKEGMMQDLFTRGIDENGNLRPSYDQAPHLYKETELGMIPKEWFVANLGDLCNDLVNGGTPPTNILKYWNGNIPWITGADFEEGKITNIRRKITTEAVLNSSTNVINKGNLLVVTRTGVGKIAIAPRNIAISQDITGVYFKEIAYTLYFYYRLQFEIANLKSFNQGTSINGITRDVLINHKLAVPNLSEQKEIAYILKEIDNKINNEGAYLSKLQKLKQGLMQDLLTGKVRVKV